MNINAEDGGIGGRLLIVFSISIHLIDHTWKFETYVRGLNLLQSKTLIEKHTSRVLHQRDYRILSLFFYSYRGIWNTAHALLTFVIFS